MPSEERPVLHVRRPPSTENKYYYIARFNDGTTSPVEITFVDDMFEGCIYDFCGPYTLEHWKVLGMIAETINVLVHVHLEKQEKKIEAKLG